MALIGIGFRSISMTPSAIGPVKAMLLELPVEKLREAMDAHIADRYRTGSVRQLLMDFAEAHSIPY